MTIVSIRSTHGGGKSTIVTQIMKLYQATPFFSHGGKKPESYLMELPTGRTLRAIGPYLSPCGGCDAVSPYSEILPRIQEAADQGEHVLFEGALVSSSYGTIGHALNEYAPHAVFAFLDTPLEVCLERIRLRRAARGNLEPLNPLNTTVKFDNVRRTKDQMARLGSAVRIVDIDHTRPVQQIMKLFGVNLRKEPSL